VRLLSAFERGEVGRAAWFVDPLEVVGPPVEGVPQPGVARSPEADAGDLAGGERHGGESRFGEKHVDSREALAVLADLGEKAGRDDRPDGREAGEDGRVGMRLEHLGDAHVERLQLPVHELELIDQSQRAEPVPLDAASRRGEQVCA
jgi:hypothetical protein